MNRTYLVYVQSYHRTQKNKSMNYLGIEQDKLKKVSLTLNVLLSDYQVYYQNLRAFHWNITGQNFFELHQEFEDLYNEAKVVIDEIAERLLTIRFRPMSKMSEYLKYSKIDEVNPLLADREMVVTILDNHKTLIEAMREVIREASSVEDEGTVDMIAGMLGAIEKKSWMLDVWLQRTESVSRSKAA